MSKEQQARALRLFSSLLPGVVEVTFYRDETFSVLGTEAMAKAAREDLPECEIVDWSSDADFVGCGTPFEVYVPVSFLEEKLRQATK